DPEFIREIALPFFDALRIHYFRAEIEGADNVPRDRPFIAVANHNGGPLLPDCWVLVSYWWSLLGVERPAYAMVHDAALRIPLVRTFLVKMGGLRASRENAAKVLRLGAPLLIYQGGAPDCLKSVWRRHAREVRVPRRPADRAGPRSRRGVRRARRAARLRPGEQDHAGDARRPRSAAAAAGLRVRGTTNRR